MTVYGYMKREVPFSTAEQLKIMGDYNCQEIFIEKYESSIQDELEALINILRASDVVVIVSLSALGEEVSDIIHIFERLREKQVQIVSWTSHLHLNYYRRLTGLL